jgi:hypothetical protein
VRAGATYVCEARDRARNTFSNRTVCEPVPRIPMVFSLASMRMPPAVIGAPKWSASRLPGTSSAMALIGHLRTLDERIVAPRRAVPFDIWIKGAAVRSSACRPVGRGLGSRGRGEADDEQGV